MIKSRLYGLIAAFAAGVIFAVVVTATWFVAPVHAQGNKTVPKTWGSVKGGVGADVIFEDAGGTVRVYDLRDGSVVTITRQ